MRAVQQQPQAMDHNGEIIADFSMTMHNLGLQRAADELVKMLDGGYWQKFIQASMTFEFLPGEFDYFLTSQAITREQVMAIRDIEAKARLEEAMDERRTGDAGYRRPILQARDEIPQIFGRHIEPFGYTHKEAKALVSEGASVGGGDRPALGSTVRTWTNSGGKTTRRPCDILTKAERLARSAVRLADDDLEELYEVVKAERQKRRRKR